MPSPPSDNFDKLTTQEIRDVAIDRGVAGMPRPLLLRYLRGQWVAPRFLHRLWSALAFPFRTRLPNRDPETTQQDSRGIIGTFCEQVVAGRTAGARMGVNELPFLYDTLTSALMNRGISSTDVVAAIRDHLSLQCPACKENYGGEILGMLSITSEASFFAGPDAGRLQAMRSGHCLTVGCPEREYRVFWVNDQHQVVESDIIGRV